MIRALQDFAQDFAIALSVAVVGLGGLNLLDRIVFGSMVS